MATLCTLNHKNQKNPIFLIFFWNQNFFLPWLLDKWLKCFSEKKTRLNHRQAKKPEPSRVIPRSLAANMELLNETSYVFHFWSVFATCVRRGSIALICCVLLQCFVDMLRVATVFCWYGACCYSALLMCCVLLQYFVDVLRVATVFCLCAACCYSALFMYCVLL